MSSDWLQHKPLMGLLSLLPLPGSAGGDVHGLPLVLRRAEQEIHALISGGVDAILVENTHDRPYPQDRLDTAAAVAMAQVALMVRQMTDLPLGISVLANDPETAIAIGVNVQAEFVRVPVLTGACVTEFGVLSGRYQSVLKTLMQLNPPQDLQILADFTPDHWLPNSLISRGTAAIDPMTVLTQGIRQLASTPNLSGIILNPEHWLGLCGDETSPLLWQTLAAFSAEGYPPLLIQDPLEEHQKLAYDASSGILLGQSVRKTTSINPLPPSIDPYRLERCVQLVKGSHQSPRLDLKMIAAASQSA